MQALEGFHGSVLFGKKPSIIMADGRQLAGFVQRLLERSVGWPRAAKSRVAESQAVARCRGQNIGVDGRQTGLVAFGEAMLQRLNGQFRMANFHLGQGEREPE